MEQRFFKHLDPDKIKLNNSHRIKMDLFLSFLTVKTSIPDGNWFGKCTGWTNRLGDNGLKITGGVVGGVEYLQYIEYGERLDNPYNNYVNPFYLFDIMTDEGKRYFVELYKEDIEAEIKKARTKAGELKSKAEAAKKNYNDMKDFWVGAGVSDA